MQEINSENTMSNGGDVCHGDVNKEAKLYSFFEGLNEKNTVIKKIRFRFYGVMDQLKALSTKGSKVIK